MFKDSRGCLLRYLQSYFLLHLTIWDYCNSTNADVDRGIVLQGNIIWNDDCDHLHFFSTIILARLGWFCPVVSEPVKPYFTRLLRVLTFCLGVSKIVIFCENGVVNGVVES